MLDAPIDVSDDCDFVSSLTCAKIVPCDCSDHSLVSADAGYNSSAIIECATLVNADLQAAAFSDNQAAKTSEVNFSLVSRATKVGRDLSGSFVAKTEQVAAKHLVPINELTIHITDAHKTRLRSRSHDPTRSVERNVVVFK